MSLKIRLITPPDIFENDDLNLLFIDISEEDQTLATNWFSQYEKEQNLNVYFYQGEPNVPWLLHAASYADFKYINLDQPSLISLYLSSHLLAKNNIWYSAANQNTAEVYSYINKNRVNDIKEFLNTIFAKN
jgi:hypothetical protein